MLGLGLLTTACSSSSSTSTSTTPATSSAKPAAAPVTAGLLSAGGALDVPLGMTLAPNGDLVVVNGNNGNAVEISPAGRQLTTKTLVKSGAGDLFGIITTPAGIVAVNDGTNALELFRG
jgi:glucose/arabinose dehydrogenase